MYIAMDCETGGLGDGVSLLTAHFSIFNENMELTNELNIKLKPDDGIYKIQAQALAINKIDLRVHDELAIKRSEAGGQLYRFLKDNKPEDDFLTPVGHNVSGDVRWVQQHIINSEAWNQFCSYRTMDSSIIARFLKACGILNIEKAGLSNLIEYFELDGDIDGCAHEERYDAIASMLSIKKMTELIKSKLK